MIAYETQNSIFMVDKIETYKLHDEFIIRFNNEVVYEAYEDKEEAENKYNELKKYLKQDKLIILKG